MEGDEPLVQSENGEIILNECIYGNELLSGLPASGAFGGHVG